MISYFSDFSKAMKAVDPSFLIISNGNSDQFFKTVMTKAGNHIDRICVSNYGVVDEFHNQFLNGTRYPKLLLFGATGYSDMKS